MSTDRLRRLTRLAALVCLGSLLRWAGAVQAQASRSAAPQAEPADPTAASPQPTAADFNARALAQYKAGAYPEAVKIVVRAIALYEGDARLHATLGFARLEMHQYAGAVRALQRAKALAAPGPRELFALGRAYHALGRLGEARSALEAGARAHQHTLPAQDRDDPWYFVMAGDAYSLAPGAQAQARAAYRRALELDPHNAAARRGLSRQQARADADSKPARTREMDEASDGGFEAGLRLGYGLAFGGETSAADMHDVVAGQLPLAIDLGARVARRVLVGVYGQYGIGLSGDTTDQLCEGLQLNSCSMRDIQVGAQVQYHFRPGAGVDPWMGLGVGLEWLGFEAAREDIHLSELDQAVDFLMLQFGLDTADNGGLRVGPFASLSLGQQTSVDLHCEGLLECSSIEGQARHANAGVHGWLVFGLRAAFAP